MSQEPKTEREKVLAIYYKLRDHLDLDVLSSEVRAQLAREKDKAIARIKEIDAASQI